MSIGQRIKLARESKGMTQEEVAKLCNTTKQTIFKYESEIVTNIPYDKIVLLSNALSVSPSYLFEWDGKEEQPTGVGELSSDKQAMYDFIDTLSDKQVKRLLQIAKAAFDQQTT